MKKFLNSSKFEIYFKHRYGVISDEESLFLTDRLVKFFYILAEIDKKRNNARKSDNELIGRKMKEIT